MRDDARSGGTILANERADVVAELQCASTYLFRNNLTIIMKRILKKLHRGTCAITFVVEQIRIPLVLFSWEDFGRSKPFSSNDQ